MKLLKAIYESELRLSKRDGSFHRNGSQFWLQRSARGIIFSANYEVALIHITADDYYKLPGGVIQAGETPAAALMREALNDIGVKAKLTDEVGLIMEYRDEHELIQFSYCYTAQIDGKPASSGSMPEEAAIAHSTLHWLPLKKAIQLMNNNEPSTYVGKFVQACDLTFLNELNHR